MKLCTIILAVILLFTGCSNGSDKPSNKKSEENHSETKVLSGYITHTGNEFCLLDKDRDKLIGFVVDDDTVLIWEDDEYKEYEEMATDECGWNMFNAGSHKVKVTYSEKYDIDDNKHSYADEYYYADTITVTKFDNSIFAVDYKPVIYLYPKEETDVSVKLDYNGNLFCTYPSYNNGWNVTAQPDGTLIDEKGMEYNYLYWEGVTNAEYDFSEGFCVKGEETAEFLEWALDELGLNRKEANEFIVFWLPKMKENKYNIISFQTKAYTDNAKLDIAPAPDTLIRVFMAYKPSDVRKNIPEQILSRPERNGFTVIEWGGAEVK